jgi:hypothetical protein
MLTGKEYYLAQKKMLLKNHDKLIGIGAELMRERYGAELTDIFITGAREEFETLIPQIPYIGGKENSLTDTLIQMTSLLALYRVMKAHDKSVDEIGTLVHQMGQKWIDQYPTFARRMIGKLLMSQFWRNRQQKKALISQQREHEGNFVFEVVAGDGQNYEWGINYVECGVVKFFHAQAADEFTPYMCIIDHLLFPAAGIELIREGTIANGCTHCDFRFQER